MEEKKEEQQSQRPVAGMPALALGAFCAFGVFVIAIVVGMSSVLAGKKLLVKASSDTPATFAYEGVSEELVEQVMKKLTGFAEGANGDDRLEFSLGLDELNSLIVHEAQFAKLKGYLEFDEIGVDLFAKISFPLERVDGLKDIGKGKYLIGRARFAVYVKKRELKIQLMEILQDNETLNIDSLGALQQINLLRYMEKYDKLEAQFGLAADIVFKDGRIFARNWKEKKKRY